MALGGRVVVNDDVLRARGYSMHRSMQEVIGCLDTVDPAAAASARHRYSCFDHASADDDGQAYRFAAAFGAEPSC
jgi:erythromycin esterase-like protein